ncbi:zeta toxin family protein [Microbacterium sp. NPDC057407]|uniref:zeta toxin family protein n=1 Tax=Microbacterium sp. NPDC057407 TaxID=3346120 RepID=UPI00366AD8D5
MMRPDSSAWRVSDAVAYDVALDTADDGLAAGFGSSRAVAHRLRVLQTDGFDRSAVDSLDAAPDTLADTASTSDDPQLILDQRILPAVFVDARPTDSPRLVLLTGQPGSGRSRAISHLVREDAGGMAVISASLLRSFVPRAEKVDADPDQIAATSASWLIACMRHAREHRSSLLLDGPIPAAAAEGILTTFRQAGYRTHVAVVASARAESLLAAASAYASSHRGRRPSELSPVEQHDRDLEEARALLAKAGAAGARLTVFDRDGGVSADQVDGPSAVRAFNGASRTPMSTLQSVQWLSELKRVTAYARQPSSPLPELAPHLLALYEAAIREVVPRLRVPNGSVVTHNLESRLASELVVLRQPIAGGLAQESPANVPAPQPPHTDGPSR